MKYKVIAVITILLLSCSFSTYAQVDTRGTEFWLTFGHNRTRTLAQVSLQVRIVAGEQPAAGNIYFTALGTSEPFTVLAGGVFMHTLTLAERTAVYNLRTMPGISDKSIRITSDNSITVYAFNGGSVSADATNVLPVHVLGTDHIHISYRAGNHADYRDAYGIVAIQDNTEVREDGILVAMLNRGQTYYRRASDLNTELTGIRVITNHPVAFFALSEGVRIPNANANPDNLFQQLAPVNTWGRTFFAPVTRRGVNRVRIVASQDSTDITQTGGTIMNVPGGQTSLTNLQAGQWVELEIRLSTRGAFIESNHPIGVSVYTTGSSVFEPPQTADNRSDPSQAWLPAIAQTVRSALIAPFPTIGSAALNRHDAIIVTPTATKNNTTVRVGAGAPTALFGGIWHDHDSGWSFYIMPLANDAAISYTFFNAEGLFVMGYGDGTNISYYYLSASAMRSLDVAFFADDIHYQDLDEDTICARSVRFRAEILGNISTIPGFLRWYINGLEETAVGDSTTWSKYFSGGTYQIRMVALMDDNLTRDTIEGTLIVNPSFALTENDTICKNVLPYIWRDTTFSVGTQSGTFVFHRQTVHGCDSIVTLNLIVHPIAHGTDTQVACVSFTWIDGIIYTASNNTATYTIFGGSSHGCDSIVMLNLTINPAFHLSEDLIICSSELPYTWHGNIIPTGTTSGSLAFNEMTIHGCDSIVTLNLTVIPILIAELNPIPPIICRDDAYFNMSYVVFSGSPRYQSIYFDEKARAAGFNDIIRETVNAFSIDIPLPVGVRPNTYRGTLILEKDFCDEKKLDFEFTIHYNAAIIIQMWNDVLALSNSVPIEEGCRLSGFQWYKNNLPIWGETGSYLHVGPHQTLDFNAEYKVRFIRCAEGDTVYTCPIIPVLRPARAEFPTLVNASQFFNISIPMAGYVEIYDLQGRRISRQAVVEGISSIAAPNFVGVYVLTIWSKTGENIMSERIIVR